LAQAPDDGIRHTAEAKREAPRVTPPDITVDVELDLGRGHGHGRGHHGRRGWH
jgi:hypothetical protein